MDSGSLRHHWRVGALLHLAAIDLVAALRTYAGALTEHRLTINSLNVYPVPDADTGNNLSMTMEAALTALQGSRQTGDLADRFGRAVVLGGRGLSGVIMSQYLKAFCEAVLANNPADAAALATALRVGSVAATASVTTPVEGTILTVANAVARTAAHAAGAGASLAETVAAAQAEGRAALARTPDQLPVLRRAGVVDSGAYGFGLFIEALAHVVNGSTIPSPIPPGPHPATLLEATGGETQGWARHEVLLVLQGTANAAQALREDWAEVGDQIVVSGGGLEWTCHIHTDDPDHAVAVAERHGAVDNVRMTDLSEQIARQRHERAGGVGIAAVASGPGIIRMLEAAGVDRIVGGGQSMNPSTADLLAAVEEVPFAGVVLLTNNPNVGPAALQVQEFTPKRLEVISTWSVLEGLLTLEQVGLQADLATVAREMRRRLASVSSVYLTKAVRDANIERPIHAGDWMAFGPRGLVAVDPSLPAAFGDAARQLVAQGAARLTVLEGSGADRAVTTLLISKLAEEYPRLTVVVREGGQPLHAYVLAAQPEAFSASSAPPGAARALPAGVVLTASYLLGAIPFSQIVARVTVGADLRRIGTGTVSGTGLYRVAGFPPLVVGGILDVAKGAVGPILAGPHRPSLAAAAGAGTVCGHNWSIFLRGAGGRGISPAMGSLLVNGWEGSALLLAGLAVGKAMRATSLGAFCSFIALPAVLGRRRGKIGARAAWAVVVPMLVKRVMGNRPVPPERRLRTWLVRFLFDQDTPRWPGGGP